MVVEDLTKVFLDGPSIAALRRRLCLAVRTGIELVGLVVSLRDAANAAKLNGDEDASPEPTRCNNLKEVFEKFRPSFRCELEAPDGRSIHVRVRTEGWKRAGTAGMSRTGSTPRAS